MTANIKHDMVGATGIEGVITNAFADGDVREWIPWEPVQPDIRQSMMGDYFRCARLFLFRHRFRMVSGGYKAAPFIGTLFHDAHAARYMGLDDVAIELRVTQEVSDYQDKLHDWLEEHSGDPVMAARKIDALEKDAALARVMSQIHWETYPLDPDRWNVVSVERELTIKLDGIPQPIGGRLDALLYHKKDLKGLVIVDHKTTSSSPKNWIRSIP